MTISSSLNAGVSGLNANATKLATISDNIANSSTFGYKRSTVDFQSIVIDGESGSGKYSAGGVRVISQRIIDENGPIISTSNALDVAVSGRGMLPVTLDADVDVAAENRPMRMTTTGSFRTDSNGLLKTETGLVLLGWPADADGNIGSVPRDTTAGLTPIEINTNQTAGDPTTEITLGGNLPAVDTEDGATGDTLTLSVEYYGNLGTTETLSFEFVPTVPASGGAATNEWTVSISDGASGGSVISEFTVTFDDSRADGGTIASVAVLSGGAYDSATGELSLTVAGGPLALTVGKPGDPNGITQLANVFSPTTVSRDGSPVGNLTAVEIDEGGLVRASYDTGFTRTLYQIPLVDVPFTNGLKSLPNQVYQVSPSSGSFFMWDAGDGPTGEVLGYAREGSATDVAGALTSLIQTQRAYSSNAKVIQTVDEMLQETTNIKR